MSINYTSQPLGQREEWRRVTVDLEGQIEDIQKKIYYVPRWREHLKRISILPSETRLSPLLGTKEKSLPGRHGLGVNVH